MLVYFDAQKQLNRPDYYEKYGNFDQIYLLNKAVIQAFLINRSRKTID